MKSIMHQYREVQKQEETVPHLSRCYLSLLVFGFTISHDVYYNLLCHKHFIQ